MGLKDLYSLGALKTKIQQEFNKFQQAFTQHATGVVNRHTADTIDMNPVLISETTVQGTINKMLDGATFLTQDTWYVNATAGNDSADGYSAATALRTLGELYRRTTGRLIPASVASVTIYLAGDFGQEPLTLDFKRSNPSTTVRVIGETVEVGSGTLTGWQALNAATNTRRQLIDGAQNFAAFSGYRVRLTSGAASGKVGWIASVASPDTVNVSQFNWYQGGSDPVIGDTYVIEDLSTKVGGLFIDIGGRYNAGIVANGQPSIENLTIGLLASAAYAVQVSVRGACYLRGCKFATDTLAGNAAIYLRSCDCILVACAFHSPVLLESGYYLLYSPLFRQKSWFGRQASVQILDTLHDGEGSRSVTAQIYYGCVVVLIGPQGIFGAAADATDCLVSISAMSQVAAISANAVLYGAGNANGKAMRVYNGSGFTYVTVPVLVAAVPDNDIVLANAAPVAWAALPAIAAAPNNAFASLYQ